MQKQRKHCLCTAMLFDPGDGNTRLREKQLPQSGESGTKIKSTIFWREVRHIFRKRKVNKHAAPLAL
jgi:hypothetical protein